MLLLPLAPLWLSVVGCVPPDPRSPGTKDPSDRPSVHEQFELDAATFPPDYAHAAEPTRPVDEPPEITVYGYWPYWGDPLETVPWDQLTHIALFDVTLDADGGLSDTEHWTDHAADAVSLAAPYGVHVDLTVTSFDDAVMSAVLASRDKRRAAVTALAALVDDYGADGVNVDFEGLPVGSKAAFVVFIQELAAEVGEVTIAMPAVDWAGAYDYDQLALAADGLFIMGYDYHYSGGDPGPVSPLDSSATWGTYGLSWTVDDYQRWGATADKLILGLPLYGVDWPTTSNTVPGTKTGRGAASLYADAVAAGGSLGRHWDADSSTPYAFPSADHQLWYDDADSLDAKIQLAVDQGLQGVGFWALTYDNHDPALWAMVDGWSHPN
jgi:spore germination protein YaaH